MFHARHQGRGCCAPMDTCLPCASCIGSNGRRRWAGKCVLDGKPLAARCLRETVGHEHINNVIAGNLQLLQFSRPASYSLCPTDKGEHFTSEAMERRRWRQAWMRGAEQGKAQWREGPASAVKEGEEEDGNALDNGRWSKEDKRIKASARQFAWNCVSSFAERKQARQPLCLQVQRNTVQSNTALPAVAKTKQVKGSLRAAQA